MLLPLSLAGKLSHRLILNILIFSGVITLGIAVVQISIEYRKDLTYLESQVAQIENSFIPSLREAVWKYNRELIRTQLESITKFKDISYAAIHDNHQLLFPTGKYSASDIKKEFLITYSYNDQMRTIGTLVIGISYQEIYGRLYQRMLVILISSAAKTFIVSLFMFFLFRTMVVRHLEKMASYFETFEIDEKLELLSLDLGGRGKGRTDELQKIEDEVNTLVSKVNTSYQKVQKELKTLSGILPICSYCKKIRTQDGGWDQMETYIENNSEADFSHSICPNCLKRYHPDIDMEDGSEE